MFSPPSMPTSHSQPKQNWFQKHPVLTGLGSIAFPLAGALIANKTDSPLPLALGGGLGALLMRQSQQQQPQMQGQNGMQPWWTQRPKPQQPIQPMQQLPPMPMMPNNPTQQLPPIGMNQENAYYG